MPAGQGTGYNAQLRLDLEQAEANAKQFAAKLSQTLGQSELDLDLSDLETARQQVKQLRQVMNQMAKSKEVAFDTGQLEQAEKELRGLQSSLDAVSEKRHELQVHADTSQAESGLDDVKDKKQDLGGEPIPLKVNTSKLRDNINRLEREINNQGFQVAIDTSDVEEARKRVAKLEARVEQAERGEIHMETDQLEKSRVLVDALNANLDDLEEGRVLNVQTQELQAAGETTEQLTGQVGDFNKRIKRTSSTTRQALGTAQDSMTRTSQHSQNMLRVLQDSQYGMMGVANNLQEVAASMAGYMDGTAQGITKNMSAVQRFGAGIKQALMPLVAGPMALATIAVGLTMVAQNWDKITSAIGGTIEALQGVSAESQRAEARLNAVKEGFSEARLEKSSIGRLKDSIQQSREQLDRLQKEYQKKAGGGGMLDAAMFGESDSGAAEWFADLDRKAESTFRKMGANVKEVNDIRREANKARKQLRKEEEKLQDKLKENAKQLAAHLDKNQKILDLTKEINHNEAALTRAKANGNTKEEERLRKKKQQLEAERDLTRKAQELQSTVGATKIDFGLQDALDALKSDKDEFEQTLQELGDRIEEEMGAKKAENVVSNFKTQLRLGYAEAAKMRAEKETAGQGEDSGSGMSPEEVAEKRRDLENQLREDSLKKRLEAVDITYDRMRKKAIETTEAESAKRRQMLQDVEEARARKREEAAEKYFQENVGSLQERQGEFSDVAANVQFEDDVKKMRERLENMEIDPPDLDLHKMGEDFQQAMVKGIRRKYRQAVDRIRAEAAETQANILESTQQGSFERQRRQQQNREQQRIDEANARIQKLQSMEEDHTARIRELEARKTQIRERGKEKRAQIRRDEIRMWSGYSQKMMQSGSKLFGALAKMQNEKSKEAFENKKKYLVAQAVIDSISAGISAFSSAVQQYPAPAGAIIGAAQSAAITAALFAKVKKIRNMEMGGNASGGGSGGPKGQFKSLNNQKQANRVQNFEEDRRGSQDDERRRRRDENKRLRQSVEEVGNKIQDQRVIADSRTSAEIVRNGNDRIAETES